MARFQNIAFTCSEKPEAKDALQAMKRLYGNCDASAADVLVPLGGDGFMLSTLRRHLPLLRRGLPIYGMNRGTVGFLMNEYREDGLLERIGAAKRERINPLLMNATNARGDTLTAYALNEVSVFRQSYQAAKLRITIDGKPRLDELVCDGAMVASPAGSTAYNLSAGGPIIPISAPLLALTPVSPFRPRDWRGALLPNRVEVQFDTLDPEKRPVNAVADHMEVKSVLTVTVREDQDRSAVLLFDRDHSWDERILREQFGM